MTQVSWGGLWQMEQRLVDTQIDFEEHRIEREYFSEVLRPDSEVDEKPDPGWHVRLEVEAHRDVTLRGRDKTILKQRQETELQLTEKCSAATSSHWWSLIYMRGSSRVA